MASEPHTGLSPGPTPASPVRVVPAVTCDPLPDFLPLHVTSDSECPAGPVVADMHAVNVVGEFSESAESEVSPRPASIRLLSDDDQSMHDLTDAEPQFQLALSQEPPLPQLVFAKDDESSDTPNVPDLTMVPPSSPAKLMPSAAKRGTPVQLRPVSSSPSMATMRNGKRTLPDTEAIPAPVVTPSAAALHMLSSKPSSPALDARALTARDDSPLAVPATPPLVTRPAKNMVARAHAKVSCLDEVSPAGHSLRKRSRSLSPDIADTEPNIGEVTHQQNGYLATIQSPRNSKEVDEEVSAALALLPLQNVAVQVPDLEEISSATPNIRAVLKALEDILENEKKRRRTDAYAVRSPERSIVVITTSSKRALEWYALLRKESHMRIGKRGLYPRRDDVLVGKKRPRDDEEDLETLFGYKDVIVTLQRSALNDVEYHHDYMRRIVVLLFDVCFDETSDDGEPSFAEKSHPCSIFMRDYYRALPQSQRPRVLAIASRCTPLHPLQLGPLEHNLFSKFVGKSGTDAVWKSCYGKGSRPAEAGFMDVENINYTVEAIVEANLGTAVDRRKAAARARRDRRAMSELEHLEEQVGQSGIMFYQRRRRHRCTSRYAELHNTDKILNEVISIEQPKILLGFSQKVCHLLNELQLAYAASTKDCMLQALIYAGRPSVAAALGEIIRGVPVFEGLEVRVVLGCAGATSLESYSRKDDGEATEWQGEETDTEAVDNFNAGAANILVVASQYCTTGKKFLPISSCSLVIRFDNSMPDPNLDGAGGRCRVITFKENIKKRSSRPTSNDVTKSAVADETRKFLSHEVIGAKDTDQQTIQKVGPKPITLSTASKVGCATKGDTDSAKKTELSTGLAPEEDDKDARVYYSRPAAALLGPMKKNQNECFMYRFLASSESNSGQKSIGIEDYVVILSQKLRENDCLIPLPENSSSIGNSSGIAAYLRLALQSPVCLSDEQIDLARQFTATIFSLASRSLEISRFGWEREASQNVRDAQTSIGDKTPDATFLRRYVLLPAAQHSQKSGKCVIEERPLEGQNDRADPSATYFKDLVDSPKPIEDICDIDWESVSRLLDLADSHQNHKIVYRDNGLAPDQFRQLEGQLVLTGFKGEAAKLSGRLCHDLSPLSFVTRSQSFPLSADGRLLPHNDLKNLVHIVVTEETLNSFQNEKTSTPAKVGQELPESDYLTVGGEPNQCLAANKVKIPVRWCSSEGKFVRNTGTTGVSVKRKRRDWSGGESSPAAYFSSKRVNLYDPTRNIKKKRRKWVGSVRYTYERYNRKFNKEEIRVLHQPMLASGRPSSCSYDQFISAIRGKPLAEICNDIVNTFNERGGYKEERVRGFKSMPKEHVGQAFRSISEEQKDEGELKTLPHKTSKRLSKEENREESFLLPERVNPFPVSTGVLLLPAVLQSMERHLLMCELRNRFDDVLGVTSDLRSVAEAVTASNVDDVHNYERYELLGDAVLKLACTLRLFTDNPHDSEGQMHTARASAVSNARLHHCAYLKGLHNYLVLQAESVADWKPPGTDVHGKAQKVSVKALADVVEALCGHYFVTGVQCADIRKGGQRILSNSTHADTERRPDVENGFGSDSSAFSSDNREGNEGNCSSDLRRKECPLSAAAVERGYIAAQKFLEECDVFDKPEPQHKEVLLSAIQAMCPRGTPRPSEVLLSAFPSDKRWASPEKPWEEEFGPLEEKLGYKFKRRPLLICALTHGSYARKLSHVKSGSSMRKEHKNINAEQTFQRLEFLGDAVADFCVVRYLFERYPGLGPGSLTDLKSNVVSNEAFARTTVSLGLQKYLFYESDALEAEIKSFIEAVKAEKSQNGIGTLKKTLGEIAAPKVLGDIFEAVIGAVFVDSGLREGWRVCMRLLHDSLRVNANANREDVHPGRELQLLVQRAWKVTSSAPCYTVEKEPGDGKRGRIATVYIDGLKIAKGRGTNDKRAKLHAALAALAILKDQSDGSNGCTLRKKLHEQSLRRKKDLLGY